MQMHNLNNSTITQILIILIKTIIRVWQTTSKNNMIITITPKYYKTIPFNNFNNKLNNKNNNIFSIRNNNQSFKIKEIIIKLIISII